MTSQQNLTRVAEAVRDAAAKAVSENIDLLRRQGHDQAATAYENAARRVMQLDLDPILSGAGVEPDADERRAFDKAADAAHFNTARVDGALFHPVTKRAFAIWRAGVSWARCQSTEGEQNA
jgi:hypothetical protein